MRPHVRVQPAGARGKRLIDAGDLGDVYFLSSSRVNLGLHQRDVSVIWDLGPHDFSILLHWLGEVPTSVRAVGRDSIVAGIPDVAFVTLTYPSGIVANVELSWLAPSKLRRTVVVGSKKMVVYEDGVGEPVRVFDHGVVYKDPETFGEYHLSYRTGDILSPGWRPPSRSPPSWRTSCRAIRLRYRPGRRRLSWRGTWFASREAAEESLRLGGELCRAARAGARAQTATRWALALREPAAP